MPEIDCQCTDEVVCPHCGYSHTESYEFFIDNGECADGCSCSDCGMEFNASRSVSVTYNTAKVEDRNGRQTA